MVCQKWCTGLVLPENRAGELLEHQRHLAEDLPVPGAATGS